MDEYGTSMRSFLRIGLGALTIALGCVWTVWSAEDSVGSYGLGRAPSQEEIRAWNIDVSSTGEGLPPSGFASFLDIGSSAHATTPTPMPEMTVRMMESTIF